MRRVVTWLLVWALTILGLRVSLLAPEVCPPVTVAGTRDAAVAAADWIADNQDAEGRYLYEWDLAIDGPTAAPYNYVRHAGTTMALYQFVLEGESSYLGAADTGLSWLLERERGNDEVAAIAPSDTANAKLGTSALLAVGLVHRRQATGDPTFDDLLRRLGTMMVGQQRPDGSMLSFWDPEAEAPVPELTSLYATGEALWALALLHNTWPDEGWDAPARRTLTYMATDRDEDEDVWPKPWADQWAAYSLHEMAAWGLDDVHTDYARRLAGQWGVATRWESQRNGGIDGLVHAPENVAAGQGTWMEGLGMLRQLAVIDERLEDIENDLGDRLLCGAGRMIAKQKRNTGQTEVDGGFFVDGTTRVDGQQHVLSGLIFAERVLESRASAEDEADSQGENDT